jgi:transcriptional regulator with XRE-family HTH domain
MYPHPPPEIIRIARVTKGLLQEYMADKLGVSQNTYSRIELGRTKLCTTRLLKIASILEISPEEILNKKENSNAFNEAHLLDLIKEKDIYINHLIKELEFLRWQFQNLNKSPR